jgi:hypothetical protein
MKYFAFTLVLAFLLSACHENQEKKATVKPETLQASNETKKSAYPYANVNLYDHFKNELILDTLKYDREGQYSPLYIGKIKDSIKLIYKVSKLENGTDYEHNSIFPDAADIAIFIDTTRTIGFPKLMSEPYKKFEHRTNKKSYPVFIKNMSTKNLQIGIGDILHMKTEAKDSTGNWREIESDFMYFCGTGLRRLRLKPNEIVVTALRQNYGRFKTKFRIRFGNSQHKIYSNEINGYLDFEL